MKIRQGHVTNSSSSCFIITNKTNQRKSLADFVQENPQLVVDFCERYNWHNNTQEEMLKDAKSRGTKWKPGEEKTIGFGDEDGDVLGRVFDYILRAGGSSESFTWRFKEYWR